MQAGKIEAEIVFHARYTTLKYVLDYLVEASGASYPLFSRLQLHPCLLGCGAWSARGAAVSSRRPPGSYSVTQRMGSYLAPPHFPFFHPETFIFQSKCIEGRKNEAEIILHIGFTTVKCYTVLFLPSGVLHTFSPAFQYTLIHRWVAREMAVLPQVHNLAILRLIL